MFTIENVISMDWFDVLCNTTMQFELMSVPTGHFWKLIRERDGYFSLMHKHHKEDRYHYQTSVGTLYDAVLYIVSHDEYQLRGRKTISVSEERKRGSYFFKLIDTHGFTA